MITFSGTAEGCHPAVDHYGLAGHASGIGGEEEGEFPDFIGFHDALEGAEFGGAFKVGGGPSGEAGFDETGGDGVDADFGREDAGEGFGHADYACFGGGVDDGAAFAGEGGYG